MKKFILAKKIGMSQLFDTDGNAVAVTLLSAGPLTVIREKTSEKDGYPALVLGFGSRKAKNIARPQQKEWKELGSFEAVREGRGMDSKGRGEKLDLTQFQEGDVVKVSGVSKAKGFQGVVRRHGFHGAPKTHGTKHAHRQPGSIGATWPQRVIKGRRMAGRMGGERITVRNLEVVRVDAAAEILAVKGAVPGRRGTLLEIRG